LRGVEFHRNDVGRYVPDGFDNNERAFDALEDVSEWLGFRATSLYNKALPALEDSVFDPEVVAVWMSVRDFDDGDENDSPV
jgi:hypothetical protein